MIAAESAGGVGKQKPKGDGWRRPKGSNDEETTSTKAVGEWRRAGGRRQRPSRWRGTHATQAADARGTGMKEPEQRHRSPAAAAKLGGDWLVELWEEEVAAGGGRAARCGWRRRGMSGAGDL
nr:unnamed protein product [Digitaria exilis]